MERSSIEAIVRTLNGANVRYLIAGGLAVVAHGYVRLTADVDLILDLEPANVRQAMNAFRALEYRPRAPVDLDDFCDAAKRAQWVRDKGLTVFSLYSPAHVATEIDVFVEPPLDFGRAYDTAARMDVAPGVSATFVGLRDLLRLKHAAARAQDLLDIDRLEALRKEPADE